MTDPIEAAIIETEREIAGAAWDIEETELDDTNDRSLESMGEGLEGQHEPEDDEDADGEDAEGDDEDPEGEGEPEGDGKAEIVAEGKEGAGKTEADQTRGQEGRVPPGRLREANERARALQAELDTFKTKDEQRSTEFRTLSEKLERALGQIDILSRGGPRTEVKPAEVKEEVVPDIFEDPKGFAEHITKGFKTELAARDQRIESMRVENSMAIAHGVHKEVFEEAFAAINKLNPQNPDDRVTVQRIYNSPNPGDALVSWHKRSKTLARVGDDPDAFAEKIRTETREALMKDPEFKKSLIESLRAEATQGDDGQPRTTTRLPRSLHRAAGSNVGDRFERGSSDDSDQAVADAAWK